MQRVVVIGAGLVGLLTALELRRRGHRVVLRSVGIAEGASFAAAGMLAPAAEIQYGQGPLWDIMREAGDLHRELAARLPGAGYRDVSTLVVGRDAADLAALHDLAAVQRSTGAEVRELTGAALRREEGALLRGLAGGVLLTRDHQVDPRLLAAAAHAALECDGFEGGDGAGPPVEIHLGPVAGYEDTGADRIVLAAGLGVPEIDGPHRRLELALRPVHGDILRLRVPPSLLLPGEGNLVTRTVRAIVRGRPVYLVPRDDRTLVLGATSREDDLAGTSAGGVLQLLQDAAEILPAVRETELIEVTTRDRPGTPDDLPLLGPVPGAEHVIISTGYHRHGILLAAWAAQRTADLIDGDPQSPATAAQLHAVRPDRFTPGAAPTDGPARTARPAAPALEEAR
ncbi:glycine oxidase ThiO [Brachybacterium sp. FME24]|uniref:glycine oxidase ThiO n=1 Tax=Brachybacterium sp. FME24 TaxID=2742605 RepID=UPI001867B63D|nr:glycine oxidase ThiO [Brachybacterium sp. FME24]